MNAESVKTHHPRQFLNHVEDPEIKYRTRLCRFIFVHQLKMFSLFVEKEKIINLTKRLVMQAGVWTSIHDFVVAGLSCLTT